MTTSSFSGRVLALLGMVGLFAYPARSFLFLSELPLALRLSWLAALVLAVRAPQLSLLLFLGLAPVLPVVPSLEQWPMVSLAELWLIGLLIGAWGEIVSGRRSWRVQLPAPAGVLLALVTASMLVILYPFYRNTGSLLGLLGEMHRWLLGEFLVHRAPGDRYAFLVSWAVFGEGLALLWLVLFRLKEGSARRMVHLLVASAVGGLLVASAGLWLASHHRVSLLGWLWLDARFARISATFSDSIALGSYLSMMLWVVVGLSRQREHPLWRWSWRCGAGLVGLVLFFTASRAAWLVTGAGVVLYPFAQAHYGLLKPGWFTRYYRRVAVGLVILAMLAVTAMTAYATRNNIRFYTHTTYSGFLLSTFNLKMKTADHLKGRVQYWGAALNMIRTHPVFGIGIGRYYNEVSLYAPQPRLLERSREHAHNYFLQVASELGITGGVAFVALIATALARVRRVVVFAPDLPTRYLALGLGTGLVAFSTTMITGHPLLLREVQFAFWPLVGFSLWLPQVSGPTVDPRAVAGTSVGMAIRRAVLAVVILAIALSVPVRAVRRAAAVDLLKVRVGLYPSEVDHGGQTFAWTEPHVVFFVPDHVRSIQFSIRAAAPFDQTVDVAMDGRLVDQLALADHAWHRVRYEGPFGAAPEDYRRIELTVRPAWTPPGDGRTLGVMMANLTWTREK